MSNTISILGCGYVGFPLAKLLLTHNWRVRGATTTESKLTRLLSEGIEPFLLKLMPDLQGHGQQDFFDSDVLIINFPPGRKRTDVGEFMKGTMESILSCVNQGLVKNVLFISSTSVYSHGHVREEDAGKHPPVSPSGAALLEAEELLNNSTGFQTTILRYGGLYGYQRRPGRFWSGRPLRNPQNAVNLLHRDDAVGVALAVITQNCWGETFNVCADQHPSRAEFYTHAATNLGLPPPRPSSDASEPDKIVINEKVIRCLGYQFKYPDPMMPAP